MTSSKDRSRMCIENSRSLTNELFDPETGQQLFKPKVGRGPRGRARSKDTGSSLYRQALLSRERFEQKQFEKEESIKQKSNTNFAQKKSNLIV